MSYYSYVRPPGKVSQNRLYPRTVLLEINILIVTVLHQYIRAKAFNSRAMAVEFACELCFLPAVEDVRQGIRLDIAKRRGVAEVGYDDIACEDIDVEPERPSGSLRTVTFLLLYKRFRRSRSSSLVLHG